MVFGDIFCCYPFSLDFVQRVGPGTSTQGLHSCIALLSVRVSSLCSPGPSLCLTKHGIRAFVFLFEFFIAQKSSMHRIRERGVGVWIWEEISRNGFGYVINFAMDTKFTPNGFLRSRQLRALLALAIYTLLPLRIMTSTLVAVYFASCSIAKHEHPRMVSFSAASFSALHLHLDT